jgi:predicted glutamine amidotransferase
MCRFTLYLGPPVRLSTLLVEPAHSLILQSYRSAERAEPLNGDGFGVGWYQPELEERPGLFRSVSPAWNDRNLASLARVVSSPCVLAHVRAATKGMEVSETNCHPFQHGRYLFMHNGSVGSFHEVRRALLQELTDPAFDLIRGSSDTEHLFALFVDELLRAGWVADSGVAEGGESGGGAEGAGDVTRREDRVGGAGAGPGGEIRDGGPSLLAVCLNRAVFRVLELSRTYGGGAPSWLNVAVSDGERAAVTRFTDALTRPAESLYWIEDGVYRPDPFPAGGRHRWREVSGVVVASERLTGDPAWREVPPNHLLDLAHETPPVVWRMRSEGLEPPAREVA